MTKRNGIRILGICGCLLFSLLETRATDTASFGAIVVTNTGAALTGNGYSLTNLNGSNISYNINTTGTFGRVGIGTNVLNNWQMLTVVGKDGAIALPARSGFTNATVVIANKGNSTLELVSQGAGSVSAIYFSTNNSQPGGNDHAGFQYNNTTTDMTFQVGGTTSHTLKYDGTLDGKFSGNGNGLTNLAATYNKQLLSNTSVTIPLSNTFAQNQALIDSQIKNLGGNSLSLNFEAGTYTNSDAFTFQHFYNGHLILQGIVVSNSLHTNQSTIIMCNAAGACNAMYFQRNTCQTTVQNLAVKLSATTTSYSSGISFYNCPSLNQVNYCYFLGNAGPYGYGLIDSASRVYVNTSFFDTLVVAFYTTATAQGFVAGCSRIRTSPQNGCYADNGSFLGRGDAIVMGTTDNTVATGGLLVTQAGKILP